MRFSVIWWEQLAKTPGTFEQQVPALTTENKAFQRMFVVVAFVFILSYLLLLNPVS
jgi:hypothetical protein